MLHDSHLYRCQRCHRVIKNPQAIKLGMGAICYAKFTGVRVRRKLQKSQTDNCEEQLELKLQEGSHQ